MKHTILAIMILASVAGADEIVLKSGKRIEWVSIKDMGDAYEIETPQGSKSVIQKDDVETLARKKAPEVLTGASIAFDKKAKLQGVDLLAGIDIKRDSVLGTWRRSGASVTGSGSYGVIAKIATSYVPPEEYDMTLVVDRKEGTDAAPDGFIVWLIGGTKQFVFQFDALGYSGIANVDGKGTHNGAPSIPGKFWTGKPRLITIMVRQSAIVCQVDGKDYFSWKAEWNRVGLEPYLTVPNKDTLHVGMGSSVYTVSRWTVSAPK